jgi:hypothetical protein
MPRMDDTLAVARLVAMTKATSPETRQDGVWRMTVLLSAGEARRRACCR